MWELPWGRGIRQGLLRRLADGWGMSGISSFRDGFPVTFESGPRRGISPATLTGSASPVRPDARGPFVFSPQPAGSAGAPNGLNSDPLQRIASYSERLGLAQPLIGAMGTLGRNRHRLNGHVNFDLNVFKNTPVTERVSVQLRSELYNAFNNTTFQDVTRNIGSPAFGQYTTVGYDSRIVQLGLRVIF